MMERHDPRDQPTHQSPPECRKIRADKLPMLEVVKSFETRNPFEALSVEEVPVPEADLSDGVSVPEADLSWTRSPKTRRFSISVSCCAFCECVDRKFVSGIQSEDNCAATTLVPPPVSSHEEGLLAEEGIMTEWLSEGEAKSKET